MDDKERQFAKAVIFATTNLGRASMLLFFAFLYTGAWGLFDLGFSPAGVLVWNGALSLLFFIQHSVMIRRGFRAWLGRMTPPHYLDAIFSLASSALLIAVAFLWQPSAEKIVELEGVARWAARGVFFLAMGGMVWGIAALKSLDAFGGKAIRDHLSGRQPREISFQVKGPYLWVRHPLYLFQLLMFWSCPDLTADRLLFNLMWTAWMYLGTVLEERDLVADFGDQYRAYQKEVPMLLPWKKLVRPRRQAI